MSAGTHDVRAVVCLPTYNERENLEQMIRALGAVLETARDRVLVVDKILWPLASQFVDRVGFEHVIAVGAGETPEGAIDYEELLASADESSFAYHDIDERAAAAAALVAERAPVADARQHEPRHDPAHLRLVPGQPGDRTDRARDEQETVVVPQRHTLQCLRREGRDDCPREEEEQRVVRARPVAPRPERVADRGGRDDDRHAGEPE